jgi:hypothetical protein
MSTHHITTDLDIIECDVTGREGEELERFYTAGRITDLAGEEVTVLALPTSQDRDEWDRLADVELASSGWRRVSPWSTDGTDCSADVEPAL